MGDVAKRAIPVVQCFDPIDARQCGGIVAELGMCPRDRGEGAGSFLTAAHCRKARVRPRKRRVRRLALPGRGLGLGDFGKHGRPQAVIRNLPGGRESRGQAAPGSRRVAHLVQDLCDAGEHPCPVGAIPDAARRSQRLRQGRHDRLRRRDAGHRTVGHAVRNRVAHHSHFNSGQPNERICPNIASSSVSARIPLSIGIEHFWSGRVLPTASRFSKVVWRFNLLKEKASADGVVMIGIDLVKRIFHVHGARKDDLVAFRTKLSRGKLLDFLASRPCRMVAIEARAIGPVSLIQIVVAGHGVCVRPDQGAARTPDRVVVGAGGVGNAVAVHRAPGFALGGGPERRSVLRAARQRGRDGGAKFACGSRQVRSP